MKKILVVDDDEAILEIVQYILESSGFEIKTHKSGLHVTEAVSNFKPDLVLLDVRLPGILGTEICREIKRKHKIPVILFSADSKYNKLFEEFNADAFIEKPFDITYFVDVIISYLEVKF